MNNLNKLYASRTTLIDLLKLRGYECDKYSNFNIDYIDSILKSMDRKTSSDLSLFDLKCKHNTEDKYIYVKYILFTKSRPSNIKLLLNEMIENYVSDGDDVIFLVQDKINNATSFDDLFDSYMKHNKIFVQIFTIDNLIINISKHRLVPYHRIISNKEKEDILTKYNLDTYEQLQTILRSDAAAKFYGVKVGDICEIVRPSETSGTYYNYRYCV
jgi:DNA-directed RNA polymerases I, II, and III subunit RPABC1